MKEHTNFNTLSGHNSPVAVPNKHGNVLTRNNLKLKTCIKKDVPIYTSDRLFESSIETNNGLDSSFSDIGLINVKENLDFIKEQSTQPEGSRLMSGAHHTLSLSRVMGLFG